MTGKTHKVTITFVMEEMTGTPEESAEVLLDVYIPEECEFHVDRAWEVGDIDGLSTYLGDA